jgi:hypothetical protein
MNNWYLQHFNGTVLFTETGKSYTWEWNFIAIFKNNGFSIFDTISNRPLCSVMKCIDVSINDITNNDISQNNIIEYKNKTSFIKVIVKSSFWKITLMPDISLWNIKWNKSKSEEFNIRDLLFRDISSIFNCPVENINKEFKIDVWVIDILVEKDWTYHIFEVKKRQWTIAVLWQLLRYWEYFDSLNKDYELYAVAESFSEKDIVSMKGSNIWVITYKEWVFTNISCW